MKRNDAQAQTHKQKDAHSEGTISINARGMGFIANESFAEDIVIAEENLHTALHGDRVSYIILPEKREGRTAGKVIEIHARRKMKFVGVIDKKQGRTWVIPDDRKIHVDIDISEEETAKLPADTKVLVEITWDDPRKNPQGKLLRVLGKKGNNDVEMEAIVLEKGFASGFPDEVVREAERLKHASAITQDDLAGRSDLRQTPTCTIDPANAKDFDDALSFVERADGTFEVGIHIADVSHYVRQNTALDREAISRSVSVYLVDRTIPMLPEILSNELCSLNPDGDKRAFSALFTLDRDGNVTQRSFAKTLIRSMRRFTYEEAQETIGCKEGVFARELGILNMLAKKIKERRHAKGAIDFEEDEVRFVLDETGKPLRVERKVRLDAHKLIEEFMLLANREVAEYIGRFEKQDKKQKPFVYRIHDVPDPQKIEELAIFLHAIGHDLTIKDGKVTSKDLNALFKKIEGEAAEGLIKTAALRAMSKAVYSTKNIGHFGLAFKHYTHFTSPIRRYPDIMVHRLLEQYLAGDTIPASELKKYHALATAGTEREIAATDAERTSIKLKQVEYMSGHIGETFDGIISGVTEWGIYIEEKNTKAEGMIRIRNVGNDYFELDKKNYRLVGSKTKQVFSLGDKVRVKLVGADIDNKNLDFAFV